MRRLAALLLPLLLTVPVPAGAVVVDRVAAVVGGEAITRSELNERWRETRLHPGPDAPASRAELLNRMIDLKVQLARARELGVQVRPEEVEDAIRRVMADNGLATLADLKAALAEEGRTVEDLRRELTDQLTRVRVIQREVTAKLRLTDEALHEAYEAHKGDYARDRELRLRQIVFSAPGLGGSAPVDPDAAARALRNGLTDRASFLAAEARLRDTPGVTAGEAGTFRPEDLRPDLARVLLALKPGEISPPVPLPNGVGLFLLDQVTAGEPVSFSEALPLLRDRLTAERTEAGIPGWLADLKRGTHIEIKDLGTAPAAGEAPAGAGTP